MLQRALTCALAAHVLVHVYAGCLHQLIIGNINERAGVCGQHGARSEKLARAKQERTLLTHSARAWSQRSRA